MSILPAPSLSISLEWWLRYQDLVKRALSPLSVEQLDLRVPGQQTVREIATHMVTVRAWYLHGMLHEGGAEMATILRWNAPDAVPRTREELLMGFDATWQLLVACLERWSAVELQETFYLDWLGKEASRGFIVWHIIEHEIHHAGELSLTLGFHGLPGVNV